MHYPNEKGMQTLYNIHKKKALIFIMYQAYMNIKLGESTIKKVWTCIKFMRIYLNKIINKWTKMYIWSIWYYNIILAIYYQIYLFFHFFILVIYFFLIIIFGYNKCDLKKELGKLSVRYGYNNVGYACNFLFLNLNFYLFSPQNLILTC
jgi:hypothetical protein